MWDELLPDSLLLEIFSYLGVHDLGSAAQVCSKWHSVSVDEYLWHSLAKVTWKLKGKITVKCAQGFFGELHNLKGNFIAKLK